MATREPIYVALFSLVSNAASFVTATRRVKTYADVDQATQPAILQMELGEKWAEPGTPPQGGCDARGPVLGLRASGVPGNRPIPFDPAPGSPGAS